MTETPSFFARRRAGLKAEREAAAQAELAAVQPEPSEIAPQEPDLSVMSDADILDLLELPDPDTLRKGDDFAAFMAKAVPLHLRNRALRRLWRSDPVLACLDGLNDYDADYLTGSTGQGVIATSYQVGKGMLAHVEKLAADAAAKADATVDEDRDDDAVAPIDAPAPQTTLAAVALDDETEADVDDTPARTPRRMRFDFGDRA